MVMILNDSHSSILFQLLEVAQDESYVWSLGDVHAAMHDGRRGARGSGARGSARPVLAALVAARTGAALDSKGDQRRSEPTGCQ